MQLGKFFYAKLEGARSFFWDNHLEERGERTRTERLGKYGSVSDIKVKGLLGFNTL